TASASPVASPAAPTTPPADGAADASSPAAGPDAAPAADAAPVAAATPAVGFAGDIDELELSKVARGAGVIKAAAIGHRPDPAKFIGFGQDEQTASWFSGYFAVILRSVTLDGWVVIGLLLVMAVISWIVMYEKTTLVNRQLRANAAFQARFRQVAADLTLLDR